MYPINKYLFETIFGKNNELYQEFMCSVDTEYTDLTNILKTATSISTIRETIHKLLSVVINIVDKNNEIIYYCKFSLMIDKSNTNEKLYSEYIKMITGYDKSLMGLIHL